MKKVILAIENKKILKKIEKIENLINIQINIKKVQYREAILEILKREKNIDLILLDEKLPGEISIEDLIKKIKIINKKINIIFFLQKENIGKENKLKKLKIKNIYYINKINKIKIINLFIENKNILKNKQIKSTIKHNIKKINKKEKQDKNKRKNKDKNENKIKNYIEKLKKIKKKNQKDKKFTKNINIKTNKKIIIYENEQKHINNLLINYLIEKNKKILLINLNNKNNINNKKNKKIINKESILINNLKKFLIKINKKEIKNNLKNFLKQNEKKYDYILFNIDLNLYNKNIYLIKELITTSDKIIYIINNDFMDFNKFIKNLKINKKEILNHKPQLYIIEKKYFFNSISDLVIKNIIKKPFKIYKIFYHKKNQIYKNKYKKIFNKILK